MFAINSRWIVLAAFGLSVAAQAEIVSIGGATRVVLQEFKAGVPGPILTQERGFPSDTSLPLQVLVQADTPGPTPEEPGGAAGVAAQFADPLLAQPNPEEFAFNLTLNSVPQDLRYQAQASVEEFRSIRFTPAEFPLRADGASLTAIGRLFLDGALVIYGVDPNADFSEAQLTMRVTVKKLVSGQPEQTVFSGDVRLRGQPAGQAGVEVSGGFPESSLILSDLSLFVEDFAVFRVLILPNLQIDYSYPATIGETFTLRAAIEVFAENAAGDAGVAAVLGTPTDTLEQVIGLVRGEQVAAKFVDALQRERREPTGELVFPPSPLLSLCGLFGIEMLLGAGLLGALRCGPAPLRRLGR